MRWRPLDEHPASKPDGAGFEAVVLPHLDAAHNLARWLVSDATVAEDVVQDAVLRALSYFASYHGGDARAWLLRIVRNTAYSTLSARQRAAAASLDLVGDGEDEPPALQVPDPADGPEAALAKRQDRKMIGAALAALPVELRECLVLREVEGLSYKQLAQVMEVPIGTAMSRLWRARRALLRHRAGNVADIVGGNTEGMAP